MKKRREINRQEGITLIALVITIVILIILATVAINAIFGEKGLIQYAEKGKDVYTESGEKQAIDMAVLTLKAKLESIGKDNLKEEIEKITGSNSIKITEVGENLLSVKFNATGNKYMVTKDGNVIDLTLKLGAYYNLDKETNEIYLVPYIENIEELMQIVTGEELVEKLISEMTQEQKEQLFLTYCNYMMESEKQYEKIEDLLKDLECSNIDEAVKKITEDEFLNLNEFLFYAGGAGGVIIENPDGSINLATLEEETLEGYKVEIGQTYTFKIKFMGIEIDKTIKVEDLTNWEWKINDNGTTVTITNYKGNSTIVTIPSEIYGMKVTEIGSGEGSLNDGYGGYPLYESIWSEEISEVQNWAYGTVYIQDNITEVILPEGIEKINAGAFSYATKLEKINIPSSVKEIGNAAFYYCGSLTNITISKGVTSIGNRAFEMCSSLSSITIPDSVTSIGNRAFDGCSSLSSITIPNSVTSIGDSAFYSCDSLSSITIPNSVTSIGDSAFYECDSLSSITIPDSVTSIGDSAFEMCSSLSNITIPDSVTSIGISAFNSCSSLSSITIPDSVTSIGDHAFGSCSSLSSITIPDSVTSIEYGAFDNCSNLSSITIPNSITSIGNYAFRGCENLTQVNYKGTKVQWNNINIGTNNSELKSSTIICSDGTIE